LLGRLGDSDFVKMISKIEAQKGFTIIELMISTIIFSLVLLGATAAIIQIGKQFYKGLTLARTQEATRSTVEEIAQSIQYTSRDIKVPNYPGGVTKYYVPVTDPLAPDTFYFCVGNKRYSFALGKALQAPKTHVLWVDEPNAGCANAVVMGPADLNLANPSADPTYPGVNGRELLGKFMRITELSVSVNQQQLWTISLSIVAGDISNQLVTVDPVTGEVRVTCEGEVLGSEFCAISEISVNATKRIQ
jgi:prepilin-type N-terminal cleavage/methylation domain-containing protein